MPRVPDEVAHPRMRPVNLLVWWLQSQVATEGTEAPPWGGGTTWRSKSYGKEFQRCPGRMQSGAE